MKRRLVLKSRRDQRLRERRALFRTLGRDNDTGFATGDLRSILEQHRSGQWSEPMTADEFIEWMKSVVEK